MDLFGYKLTIYIMSSTVNFYFLEPLNLAQGISLLLALSLVIVLIFLDIGLFQQLYDLKSLL